MSKKFELEIEGKKDRFVCKQCGRATKHTIVANYKEDGSSPITSGLEFDWYCRYQIIQCDGCEEVSFRETRANSEDVDYEEDGRMFYNTTEVFYPPRTAGLKSIETWYLPNNVEAIYEETVLALQNQQNVLAGIGVRALIETVCKDRKAEGKDLFAKINWLKEQSIVTAEGSDVLHKLRTLGNQAAHEVKKHTTEQLSLAIEVVKHILEGVYVIPKKSQETFNFDKSEKEDL